jgi:4-hydroxy-2-oxoheptanedioate aldolase
MDFPTNHLKRNLRAGEVQTGCWLSLASHASAEICAGAGFDWVLIDMEHAPSDLPQVHQQLHAASAYRVSILVRAPWNDTVLIKRLLDLGVQSLLLPYVQNAEEARRAVAAVRYPPRWRRCARARGHHCLPRRRPPLLRSRSEATADREHGGIDGVDGLFIGPQDLAADLGHLGNPGHPEVQAAIAEAIARIKRTGKAPGLLNFNEAEAKRWIEQGAQFVAVTSDQFLLAERGGRRFRSRGGLRRFRRRASADQPEHQLVGERMKSGMSRSSRNSAPAIANTREVTGRKLHSADEGCVRRPMVCPRKGLACKPFDQAG